MSKSPALALLLTTPVLACVTAPAPAPAAPAPATPTPAASTLELRLAPEDRALLAALVERLALRGDSAAPARPSDVEPRVHADLARPLVPRDTRNLLVSEGPLALATYTGGQVMYQGTQIESPQGWERHGPWRAWHPDGQPWEEGAYEHEQPHGPWRWWYEDGTLQAEGSFEHGRHVGPWRYFHPNGALWAEGRHADDRPVGLWRVYDESGARVSEFDHGE